MLNIFRKLKNDKKTQKMTEKWCFYAKYNFSKNLLLYFFLTQFLCLRYPFIQKIIFWFAYTMERSVGTGENIRKFLRQEKCFELV